MTSDQVPHAEAQIAALIQHTNVKPAATQADIEKLLDECLEHEFDGAMLNPIWIPLARQRLSGSRIKTCTALDFPMGGETTESVAGAAASAVTEGAQEIDVMTKVGWLKSGFEKQYENHLASIVAAAGGAPVKAMLEVALLTESELERAVELCIDAGVSYIKNSSGYGGGNATAEIVRKLRALARERVKVKASGGIRTLEQALSLTEAGAQLLGTSAGVEIVTGRVGSEGY